METKILNTLDLVGIAQITGANRLVTRVPNEIRFELSEEQKRVFKGTHFDLDKLAKFKDSECVWIVESKFFDNYARALHMALSVCRIRIDEKDIDFEDNSLPESYEANANRTR